MLDGYKNLQAFLENLNLPSGNIVYSDDNDYLVSCYKDTLERILMDTLSLANRYQLPNNTPSLFYKIFGTNDYPEIKETFKHALDNLNSKFLRQVSDNNDYEIVEQKDWINLSDETYMKHAYVSMEIITNRMCANLLRMHMPKPSFISSQFLDGSFIEPPELSRIPGYKERWQILCTSAHKLKDELINNGTSIESARSILPDSAAQKINNVAPLESWYHLVNAFSTFNVYQSSENMDDIIKQLISVLRQYEHVKSLMNSLQELEDAMYFYDNLPF